MYLSLNSGVNNSRPAVFPPPCPSKDLHQKSLHCIKRSGSRCNTNKDGPDAADIVNGAAAAAPTKSTSPCRTTDLVNLSHGPDRLSLCRHRPRPTCPPAQNATSISPRAWNTRMCRETFDLLPESPAPPPPSPTEPQAHSHRTFQTKGGSELRETGRVNGGRKRFCRP